MVHAYSLSYSRGWGGRIYWATRGGGCNELTVPLHSSLGNRGWLCLRKKTPQKQSPPQGLEHSIFYLGTNIIIEHPLRSLYGSPFENRIFSPSSPAHFWDHTHFSTSRAFVVYIIPIYFNIDWVGFWIFIWCRCALSPKLDWKLHKGSDWVWYFLRHTIIPYKNVNKCLSPFSWFS